jgi:23S rRNA (guanosine2251-2'-O)-methyltransferase
VILYGRNPVHEALRGRRAHSVSEVWVTAGAAREPWLDGVEVKVRSAEEIERRCGSPAHQGVCAAVGGYPYVGSDELLGVADPLIVALDQVQDPQNLGSICRTAECVGATGVVIPERRSADVTPAVCKASAGAVEHIRIARVRNVADFIVDARRAGCWSYGASAPVATGGRAGEPGASAEPHRRSAKLPSIVPYGLPDYSGGVVLVLGSEGGGLRPRVTGACDQLVTLPLRGRVQSLGVAAAAAALLYGILHDRDDSLDKAP